MVSSVALKRKYTAALKPALVAVTHGQASLLCFNHTDPQCNGKNSCWTLCLQKTPQNMSRCAPQVLHGVPDWDMAQKTPRTNPNTLMAKRSDSFLYPFLGQHLSARFSTLREVTTQLLESYFIESAQANEPTIANQSSSIEGLTREVVWKTISTLPMELR